MRDIQPRIWQLFARAGGGGRTSGARLACDDARAALVAAAERHLRETKDFARTQGHASDLRVRVLETGLSTYPDVTVVCDALQTDPADPKDHTVVNPTLVVEVLSPSTEEYDRGEKLAQYKRITGLDEIVLVAHDARRLEMWRRRGAVWTLDIAKDDARAELKSLECTLSLSDVYNDPLS